MSPLQSPVAPSVQPTQSEVLNLEMFPCLLTEDELGLKIEEQVQIAWNGTNTTHQGPSSGN